MGLPVRLGIGLVSIYGYSSPNGISSDNPNFISGVVDNVYLNEITSVSVGQFILFDVTKTEKINYDGNTYYVSPVENVLFVENEL